MSEEESNPYESPRVASKPPVGRLGLLGRFAAAVAVVGVGLASFVGCFFSVCYVGFEISSGSLRGAPTDGDFILWLVLSTIVGLAAAILVGRAISKRYSEGEELS